ncbi:hypothetical protein [uncultured Shewanella sp.]|uniref:hypothetical protein n=1 Tax=uncultured Shewanella sp. TaxID=173975 RepID=UPI002628C67F|nr:hypothetical protein [uncultured Shewanella sp.]
MKLLSLLLLITPMTVSASAPFGVTWGEDITKYGEVTKRLSYSEVKTDNLPKNNSIAKLYKLVQTPEKGLVKVVMTTHYYSAHGVSFKSDYNDIKNSLIGSGYQTLVFSSAELSSYQCVLQGQCKGKRWVGVDSSGDIVNLEQKMLGRENAFIHLEFASKDYIDIENQQF